MLLTNLLMHIPGMSRLYLWWRRHQAVGTRFTSLVAHPTMEERAERCLWCWSETHTGELYPHHTSSMCVMHSHRQRASLAASRAARAAGKEAAA